MNDPLAGASQPHFPTGDPHRREDSSGDAAANSAGPNPAGPLSAGSDSPPRDDAELRLEPPAAPPPPPIWHVPPPRKPPEGDDLDADLAAGSGALSELMRDAGHHLTDAVGLARVEGFSPQEMFSEVLRERSDEELEHYFNVGAASTTPDLLDVDANWPKPWAFVRALGFGLVIYFGFYWAFSQFGNPNMIPGLMLTGSFATPLAILIFFFEMNVLRNVSLYQIFKLVLLGGIVSLIATLVLGSMFELDKFFGASAAGIIEETAKTAALLIVINRLEYRWTLNGLLLGAAVGTGFGAFESAGYAFVFGIEGLLRTVQVTDAFGNTVLHPSPTLDPMLEVITLRGMLAFLGGHGMWTALVGAALWKVRGDQEFELEMLLEPQFYRIFFFAVGVHMIWNMPTGELAFWQWLKFGILAAATWWVTLAVIQDGLRQVRTAQIEWLETKAAAQAEGGAHTEHPGAP